LRGGTYNCDAFSHRNFHNSLSLVEQSRSIAEDSRLSSFAHLHSSCRDLPRTRTMGLDKRIHMPLIPAVLQGATSSTTYGHTQTACRTHINAARQQRHLQSIRKPPLCRTQETHLHLVSTLLRSSRNSQTLTLLLIIHFSAQTFPNRNQKKGKGKRKRKRIKSHV